ncbi:MAG: acyl CoA:acetate/3-ketoacid CoA transferase [Alicyclobacillaceae bacterium]|nr:acyl CoA:acetate/3-ketoacid CoA transferase [Alicyclobacillaceae bacterium]
MAQQVDSRQVAAEIADGATVALAGFGGMAQPDEVLLAIRERFLKEGRPRDLTVLHPAGQSDTENGIELLALEGLVKRVIGGHWGLAPRMRALIESNRVECYCLPQGQITQLFRTMANGLPGQLSTVGLGTFVDPALDGGRFNEAARDQLVERVELFGETYLFYKAIPIDVAILRGTIGDERGNISQREEALKLESLAVAQAAKRFGGTVVVQVKHVAQAGTLHPKDVVIPGIFVDYLVKVADPAAHHRQTPGALYNPAFSGDLRAPRGEEAVLPLSLRKIIGRRAVLELRPGAVINLGIGIPGDVIGPIILEEGLADSVTVSVESGAIGGMPLGGNEFGIAYNPEAIIEHAAQFDFYHGIGVDVAFMGAAEVDAAGNVNVSKFGGRSVGCGGFIDITQCARKVVFCLPFTGGRLSVRAHEGGLSIVEEGQTQKFVSRVQQVTFSGSDALRRGTEVWYVTERAAFRLTEDGVMLEELAPGVDLERDVLRHMGFRPKLAERVRLYHPAVFAPGPMRAWLPAPAAVGAARES